MSDNNINVTAPLHAATKQGKLTAAREVFMDGDKETLQQIGDKTHQLENAIKDITATGGASTANAVSYSNETSGMTAVTAQGAIDELVAKNKTQDATIAAKAEKTDVQSSVSELKVKDTAQDTEIAKKANAADVTSQMQTEQTRVNAELDKKFNKEDIAQDFGESKDKVVSQFALPYRYIQNEEFIFAKVDANNKLLFGFQWDGTPVFGKTSAVEDRLQAQVNILADKIRNILGDDDTTSAIDTLKELKNFFASIDNTQTLTSILTNLNSVSTKLGEDIKNLQDTKVDKEEGKSLVENEVKECFKVIENEEFFKAIVDAENRVLYGIYRESGKPYYPLNEMYHVIQNEEYFAAWVTTDDKVVLGLRRDGEIIGEIHAVNALKQVISQHQSDLASLQEKVGTIDSNLKELLDVFSLQENEEYLAVEQDAEGKVLAATYNDGSHYSHNLKSETIDAKVDKEEGKSLINADVADANASFEDVEGRTEITEDSKGKVLGYRDSEGTRHEHKISVNHIDLSEDAAKEVNDAFKSAGIKTDNPSDFSKNSYVELPIPRVAAQVKLYAPKLPTTKQDDIEAEIEYNNKDGNYFRKPVILNAQGSSSMSYYVKNMAIDINDESKIKFGDFPSQDSFHLKKYFIDIFRGQCIVGYWLMEQVYQTRAAGKRYPYELLSDTYSPYTGNGKVNRDFYTGAKCHPDGFPVVITWVNTKTKEEKNMGVYAWNLKKSKEIYHADKKTPENIILDGVIDSKTLFGGTVDWMQFEIRNPKSLIDINGNKYDGDNPKELSETDKNSKKVKDYLVRLSGVKAALTENNTKETFEKYFIAESFIDYFVISQVLYHLDGFKKNWIWCTWDGQHWAPTLYDVDSILGAHWNGTFVIPNSDKNTILGVGSVLGLETLYADEIKARYKQLRDSNIFSVDNIINLLEKWLNNIGYENMENEIKLYPDTPSYRNPNLNSGWEIVNTTSSGDNFNAEKTYNVGDTCIYFGYIFKASKELTNVPPLSAVYSNAPKYCGFYNSVKRVSVWLTNRLSFLDKTYSYTEI